jgi:Spy/CpxP family protein refolding chaperone
LTQTFAPEQLTGGVSIMRTVAMLSAVLAVSSFGGPAAATEQQGMPYAGQQMREIKALSADEIAALRNGEGMGLAKAAELNGYPGPRHVLDLASELNLSAAQKRQLTALYEQMNAEARALVEALIERERALDAQFAGGTLSPESLGAETARIADIQGRLRTAHLAAHLETHALLGSDQVAQYNRLRGYAERAATGHQHPAGHRH